ncbi:MULTISPECIES: AtpZ/AtpI family protein [unclassified Desulfovibrio]|uniref:AtpZ/AtpI family protein n=1 Tax=unclassified Desulfovibrio TaxID=2593640 RepID=UPI001F15570E|nr:MULTISPECIES: AtpZ/AtpI family protein [unclassified Desulfovibrio]
MSFRDILGQQRDGMRAMATTGVMGLHLVSGPLVGFAIGYGLDAWLGTSPWCKIIFLLVGIGAGFLNVYRDTQELLRKLEKESRRGRPAAPGAALHGAPVQAPAKVPAEAPGGAPQGAQEAPAKADPKGTDGGK